MELHTFSSLNLEFLKLYHMSMSSADEAFIYYNEDTIKHKRLENIEKQDVYDAFGSANVKVFNSSIELEKELMSKNWLNANLLMMSSGNFDGLDFDELASNII